MSVEVDWPVSRASVFETFGVRPVINCCGIYTDLGGSVLSPSIWTAFQELNSAFVRMPDLLDNASAVVAALVGAEAARITPGASAALALAVGATMVGQDQRQWDKLPDPSAARNEVIIAASHLRAYKYAVCARVSGATLVAAGPEAAFDLEALLGAVTHRTACILVPAHLLDGYDGVTLLSEVVAEAHLRGVPVVVDAAYMCDPPELMREYALSDADLTCFSAKYFGGPNGGGFVSGSAKLVRVVEGLDFTRFESGAIRSFGRVFKMGRYEVVATALALKEWIERDPAGRWKGYADKVGSILASLPPREGVTAQPSLFTMDERLVPGEKINCLALTFSGGGGLTAERVSAALEEDNPTIVGVVMDDRLILAVDALIDGQEQLVGERLAGALAHLQ